MKQCHVAILTSRLTPLINVSVIDDETLRAVRARFKGGKPRKTLTKEQISDALRRYADDDSVPDIAADLGVTPACIYSHIRKVAR